MNNLKKIKQRCKTAIPHIDAHDPTVTARGGIVLLYGPHPMQRARAIANFYQHARTDIPSLVDEIEDLHGALQAALTPLEAAADALAPPGARVEEAAALVEEALVVIREELE